MACADHVYAAFGVGSLSSAEVARRLEWSLCCSDGVLLTDVHGTCDIAAGLPEDGMVQISGTAGDGLGRDLRGGTVTVFGDAGDEVGAGMQSGVVVVRGSAGERVGVGMAGGTILVLGEAGAGVGQGMTGGVIYLRDHQVRKAAAGTV